MTEHRLPAADLDAAGLNRQHVFPLARLPESVLARLGETHEFRQLILLGHAGRLLWQKLQTREAVGEHPIDDYSIAVTRAWFARHAPNATFRIVYPGDTPLGLQQLGQLAGWHHPSPLMIGIDGEWGSWFAYRVALLADTAFLPSPTQESPHPCHTCASQPCHAACPADAVGPAGFMLDRCSDFRRQPDSPCATTCLARLACPVGSQHRYDDAQLSHTYSRSLTMIKDWAKR